jgi:hypothetical protein
MHPEARPARREPFARIENRDLNVVDGGESDRGEALMDLQVCIAEAQRDQRLPGQRLRTAVTRGGFSIDEILASNGNKPISSSATPLNRFVIERNCRERRTTELQAPLEPDSSAHRFGGKAL